MSEKLMFKIGKGALIPADEYTVSKLRTRNYKLNDVVLADITKPRNPKFNRLIHKLGKIVTENIADFHGMDAHSCIKRLQIEANAGCEEIAISLISSEWSLIKPILPALKILVGFISKATGFEITDSGMAIVRTPKSLSFATMDQVAYEEVAMKICYHIHEVYWPTSTPEQIERMALQYVEAT